jgi:PAS domain S-box-containing protein
VESEAGNSTLVRRKFEIAHHPIRNAEGAVAGVTIIGWDVTERKQAEAALRKHSEQLNNLMNTMDSSVFALDRHYRYTSFNRAHEAAMQELYGSSIVMGGAFLKEISVAGDRKAAAKIVKRALAGEIVRVVQEIGEARRDRRLYEVTLFPIRDAQDAVTGAMVLARDVTEQVHAEKALRVSEEKHRLLLESAPWAIGYYDMKGKLVVCNTLAARNLGGVPGDFEGKMVEELFGPPWPRVVRERMRAAAGQEEMQSYEDQMTLVTGTRWYATTYSRVRNTEGRIVGVQIVSADITEQKETEKSLREQQNVLTHLSRVASLGELTSNIAHELNQPLGASLLYAETCLEMLKGHEAGHPAPVRKAMESLVRELDRAQRIIDRIRNFGRKRNIARASVDIGQTMHDAVMLLSHELQVAEVTVRFALPAKPLVVHADQVLLQQVLVNLIMNAMDAMGGNDRPRRLTLGARQVDEGTCEAMVADTGAGLAPTIAGHVFEAFHTTKATGLGLGLSIVKSIVVQHGGRIWHEPATEGGTVFRFTIPTHDKEAHHGARASERIHRG